MTLPEGRGDKKWITKEQFSGVSRSLPFKRPLSLSSRGGKGVNRSKLMNQVVSPEAELSLRLLVTTNFQAERSQRWSAGEKQYTVERAIFEREKLK